VIGILVAVAVIAHDFADGLNTVSMMLRHQNTNKQALKFLLLMLCASFRRYFNIIFTLSEKSLLIILDFSLDSFFT